VHFVGLFFLQWNLIFMYFSKICRKNSSFIKTSQQLRVLCMKTNVHLLDYLAEFFLERENFQTEVAEKIEKHILCSTTFSRKSFRWWYNVQKYTTAGQPTDDNIIGHMRVTRRITKVTDTHSEYVNTCCCSTTMATRTCLNVTCIGTLPVLFDSVVYSSKTVTIKWGLEGGIQNGHGSYSKQHTHETESDVRGKSYYGYMPARTGFTTGGGGEEM
jgi:hypothetical protein